MKTNYQKALTLEERRIIENGIVQGSTKTSIADVTGKDKSTIGKEIKLHRTLTSKCRLPLECSAYKKCKHGRVCTRSCPDFIQFRCSRRDRSPGACNGCDKYNSCRFDKYRYKAEHAEKEYRELLVQSREGVNLTTTKAKEMAVIIKPLLEQGHSPYQIVHDHPELGISEKTLYNYIEQGVLEIAGIGPISLRRQVSRKISKKKAAVYKKREDRTFIRGRTYADFETYMADHPAAHVVEMDTVYNDVTNGPFVQTFKFRAFGLMIALFHETKTAADMLGGIDRLDQMLGDQLFNRYVEVLKTDRGGEFSAAEAIESRTDGTRRTRLFYCDPMQSCQKGSLEVNHEQLRYILPKGYDLRSIGLVSQEALDLAISHIASSSLESLNGKSPAEYTAFLAPDLWEKLSAAGLRMIPKDEIILKPSLLKQFICR